MKEKEVPETYINRENKDQYFDKRLIREVVRLVEAGLPRRQAIVTYGMTQGTLSAWMRRYGSLDYQTNKRRVFKATEKRSILRSMESGMSLKETQIAFGVKSITTIKRWMSDKTEKADLRLITTTIMPKKQKDSITDEVTVLRQALAEAQLKIKVLDTMIDIAEEQLKIDIRKKSGARQSPK